MQSQSLYARPRIDGEYRVFPSPHANEVLLVDRAVMQIKYNQLDWYAADPDTDLGARAALAGYAAAGERIKSSKSGGQKLNLGDYTEGQFRHIVANGAALIIAALPTPSEVQIPHCVERALLLESTFGMPTEESYAAFVEVGLEPDPETIGGFERQLEIQKLIGLASETERTPAILCAWRNPTAQELRKKSDYGWQIADWITQDRPDLFERIETLSSDVGAALIRNLMVQPLAADGTLAYSHLHKPVGTSPSELVDEIHAKSPLVADLHISANTKSVPGMRM